jgi:hypothetical protein
MRDGSRRHLRRRVREVNRDLIQKAIDEARSGGANLVIWDERDTFTVEQDDMADLEVGDDHLRVKMQDGRVTVYVQLDKIYKLVVEKTGARAGFGAS